DDQIGRPCVVATRRATSVLPPGRNRYPGEGVPVTVRRGNGPLRFGTIRPWASAASNRRVHSRGVARTHGREVLARGDEQEEPNAVPAFRLIAAAALAVAVAAPLAAPTPTHAAVTPIKIALIVGPMGSNTSWNRQHADQIAQQAQSIDPSVIVAKAYSPNATYAKVRAAVAGANIVVYLGHGSGYPNPYHGSLLADRNDGWGLNTTTTHGDQDSWANHTLVYCGEKALQGQLTSTDGADQRKYCGGGAIAPAPGFVMVYIGSCYTAGGNEPQNPKATNSDARAHISYYSRPMFQLGASGYFAGRTMSIVQNLLANPDLSYGDIFNMSSPWGLTGSYTTSH